MKKINIFRIGQLGDTLFVLPILAYIRHKNPNARIVYIYDFHNNNFADPSSIIELAGLVDEFKTYEFSNRNNLGYLFKFLIQIIRLKADEFYYIMPSTRTLFSRIRDYLFFRLTFFGKCIGFNIFMEILFTRNYKRVRKQNEFTFLIKSTIATIYNLKKQDLNFLNNYTLPSLNKINVKNSEVKEFVSQNNNYVIVNPGGKFSSKKWPVNNFRYLIEELAKRGKVITMIGNNEELMPYSDLGIQGIKIFYNTALIDIFYLISNSSFFVGNDSGPLHIANIYKIQGLALFSGYDYLGKWFPSFDGIKVLKYETSCSPCFLKNCNNNGLCMAGITPDDALKYCI